MAAASSAHGRSGDDADESRPDVLIADGPPRRPRRDQRLDGGEVPLDT